MQQRDPFDLLDQMYTLAYWMTGSLKKTNDLVYRTYNRINSDASEIGLFRAFRSSYQEDLSREAAPPLLHPSQTACDNLIPMLRQERMDMKFAALLADICNLKHAVIAIIIGKPLNTIRLWLTSGRKYLLEAYG